ncbi:hypothetical protein T310_9976, partial [Rasamsonia emersonii CBS 393.64]
LYLPLSSLRSAHHQNTCLLATLAMRVLRFRRQLCHPSSSISLAISQVEHQLPSLAFDRRGSWVLSRSCRRAADRRKAQRANKPVSIVLNNF